MQNDIMDAVTNRLFEMFGEDCEIHTNSVEQDLKEPCFFVSFLEPSRKSLLGRQYRIVYGMSIQYFPSSRKAPERECNEVMDSLTEGMEYITLADGRMRRGREMSGRVEDGILTFLVTYDLFGARQGSETEAMKELEVKGAIQ